LLSGPVSETGINEKRKSTEFVDPPDWVAIMEQRSEIAERIGVDLKQLSSVGLMHFPTIRFLHHRLSRVSISISGSLRPATKKGSLS
jgi:hypothetical protein